MKIKITGRKVTNNYLANFNKPSWFDYQSPYKYKILGGGNEASKHELQANEIVEFTLNDKITLYLSMLSFLSLMPKTNNPQDSTMNLADCDLQIDDISQEANY